MAGESFDTQTPYLAPAGMNDLKYNKILDIESDKNIVSIPLMAVDQIAVGVLQISGKLSTFS